MVSIGPIAEKNWNSLLERKIRGFNVLKPFYIDFEKQLFVIMADDFLIIQIVQERIFFLIQTIQILDKMDISLRELLTCNFQLF